MPTLSYFSYGQFQNQVSLGQGQGPKAERAIKDGAEQGLWVILQNCQILKDVHLLVPKAQQVFSMVFIVATCFSFWGPKKAKATWRLPGCQH